MISDDKYAWYANLGKDTAEEAYKVVRDEIVKVATLAKAGNYLNQFYKEVMERTMKKSAEFKKSPIVRSD